MVRTFYYATANIVGQILTEWGTEREVDSVVYFGNRW